jgi:hypothetical protein
MYVLLYTNKNAIVKLVNRAVNFHKHDPEGMVCAVF